MRFVRYFALFMLICFQHSSVFAAPPTLITTVPVTLSVPGNYLVNNALVYAGPAGTAAITVTANDVFIDFDHYTLTLSVDTMGIFAQNVSNLQLQNGTIQATAPSTNANSFGVRLLSDEHVTLDNMIIKNTFRGV